MEHRFDTTHPLSADLRIPAGRIAVRVQDEPVTTVNVEGARADDVAVGFDARPAGDRLTVEYRGKKLFGWLSIGSDLAVTIDVPAGTTLDVSTGSADLEVGGTVAGISFRSGSGELRFDDVTGDVIAKTASGDIFGGDVAGNLRSHGASGDVSIAGVAGSSACRSASGDLSLGRVAGDAQLASASGDVDIGVVTKGKSTIRTVSGDAQVGVGAGAEVYLDLASTSGDVACDLEPAGGSAGGSAELVLDVASVSGDVRVRRVASSAGGA
jgi:DUF4097 and DUF4098 domain-containing protein YvlB